ncbi:MAG TPA: PAS domain-containing protein [Thermoanaerobaculia bacterium]|nr:PAS domain-containing protein [Thermoanaerobaculia bacterium]
MRDVPPVNPFRGLRPFSPREAHLFFGRDGRTEEMIRKLTHRRVLAVVGASGSGKSSLVGAGLVPALLGQDPGSRTGWRVASMRPGGGPIRNLAEALNAQDVLGSEGDGAEQEIRAQFLENTLRRSSRGLIQAVRQSDWRGRLLIVVDQFEEVFRYRAARADRGDQAPAFVALLLEAAAQRELPIYVCITMRSDFFGDCSQFHGLPEAINDGQYLVPRMTRSERKAAIAGPMQVVGAEIAPRLVQRLLNDVGDATADQLPILQHALMRTFDLWQRQHPDDPAMDLAHYEAIGTVEKALNQHAEQILGELDEKQQQLAEDVFRRLTMRVDNREIRYPTRLDVLAAVTGARLDEVMVVVDAFRAAERAFLMPPEHVVLTPESGIDISHESLMRIWRRLGEWVDKEARSAQIYRRLRENAELHEQGEADLYSGPSLESACAWFQSGRPNAAWAERYGGGFESAIDFLQASLAREEERKALQEKIRRAEAEALAMREQSAVLRNILTSIPHGVFWKDRDCVYQGSNARFSMLAALSHPDEIVGKTDFDLPWTREEAEHYRRCDREVMESGEPMMHIEEPQRTSEGEKVLLTDKVPLRNALGEVIGVLGIYLDITERKRTERALEEATARADRQSELLGELREQFLERLDGLSALLDGEPSGDALRHERLHAGLKELRDLVEAYEGGTSHGKRANGGDFLSPSGMAAPPSIMEERSG